MPTDLDLRRDLLPGAELPGAGPAQLDLPRGLSYAEWAQVGLVLTRIHRGVQWWLGDWLCYGEHVWGEKYAQAASDTGLHPDSLKRYQWVASRLAPERRQPALSFTHHELVAALPAATADRLLERAAREQIASRDFRALVRAEAPPVPPTPGLPGSGPLNADMPPLESAMPTDDDRAHLAMFMGALQLALLALEQEPQRWARPHPKDSELAEALMLQAELLTEELEGRVGPLYPTDRDALRHLAARLAALAFLYQDPDRLAAEGTDDLPGPDRGWRPDEA